MQVDHCVLRKNLLSVRVFVTVIVGKKPSYQWWGSSYSYHQRLQALTARLLDKKTNQNILIKILVL